MLSQSISVLPWENWSDTKYERCDIQVNWNEIDTSSWLSVLRCTQQLIIKSSTNFSPLEYQPNISINFFCSVNMIYELMLILMLILFGLLATQTLQMKSQHTDAIRPLNGKFSSKFPCSWILIRKIASIRCIYCGKKNHLSVSCCSGEY